MLTIRAAVHYAVRRRQSWAAAHRAHRDECAGAHQASPVRALVPVRTRHLRGQGCPAVQNELYRQRDSLTRT
jgi:hypothetical protein